MTWRPTRFDRYVCPTPIAPVMIGMMTMIPTKIRSACMLGQGAPEHVPASGPVLGPNNALSKICLIMSGFTTPRPAEMTIATPTIVTWRR